MNANPTARAVGYRSFAAPWLPNLQFLFLTFQLAITLRALAPDGGLTQRRPVLIYLTNQYVLMSGKSVTNGLSFGPIASRWSLAR